MPVKGVVASSRVPVKIWADLESVESQALDQLKNTASLPFVFKHVAAMPDVHLGIGATVGSVVATQGAICPAAVGVDIGCGMCAQKTSLKADDLTGKLAELRSQIERSVPVGFNGNSKIAPSVEAWPLWNQLDSPYADRKLLDRATSQMGTLGGGNHFIEICLDTDQNVWIMLHSGSRNIGKSLAERHIHGAKDLMKEMFIALPDPDLAYFVESSQQFQQYMNDVSWAQAYALQNRTEMMSRIKNQMRRMFPEISFSEPEINCHHNYVSREHHFGQNVLVTRKGAVRARQDDLGIIPGSMGTRSFIVRGRGNPESFNSCSHGAGRRMSRTQAKKQFTVADLEQQTSGVECRKDAGVLDEIPGAYKAIEEVMENQSDLVEIVAELKQVLCVKG